MIIFLNNVNTYNELNQLTCALCKIVVKSEALWPVHLNSKTHKDTVLIVKQTKEKLEAAAQVSKSQKRPSTFQEPHPAKKVKGILKNSANAKANLPDDFFESAPSTSNSIKQPPKALPNGDQKSTNGAIPKSNSSNGFHKTTEMETDAAEVKNSKDSGQSTLPEGFFDDPIKDAKVIILFAYLSDSMFHLFNDILSCTYFFLGSECRV